MWITDVLGRSNEAFIRATIMPKCRPNLRQLRLEAKLSQNRLARQADLDRTTVSSAENGREVSEITVSKLSSALSDALKREITDADITQKENV